MKHLQNTYNSFKRKIEERITNETELEEVEKKQVKKSSIHRITNCNRNVA